MDATERKMTKIAREVSKFTVQTMKEDGIGTAEFDFIHLVCLLYTSGIAYATDQIIDLLANGVKHIHVYSMNKPDVAAGIQRNLSEILKA